MNTELLLEAERRGLLPPEKISLLAEARRRGLVANVATKPLVEQIPGGEGVSLTPDYADSTSLWEKAKAAGQAVGGSAQGMLASIPANFIGAAKDLLGGTAGQGSTIGQDTAAAITAKLARKPQTQLEADYTQSIGSALNDAGMNAVPGVAGITGIGNLAKGLKTQTAPIARAAGGVVADLPSKVGPQPSLEVALLGKKFQDMGGQIPLHALATNRVSKMAGDWIENLPLSGSRKEGNKLAFNQELIRQLGGDAKSELLTPASFAPAMDASGKVIGSLYGKVDIPVSSVSGAINNLISKQGRHLTESERMVRGYADEVARLSKDTGTIPGSALRELDTEMGATMRGKIPDDVKAQLSDFQEILRDALESRLTAEDASALKVARTQYAKGKLVEPLVAKNGPSGITPSDLIGRVNSTAAGKHRMATGAAGEIGDLAGIGSQFLKDTPSSGMGERGLLLGGVIATGKALPGLLLGNAYNRLGPLLSKRAINNTLARALKSDAPATPSTSVVPYNTPVEVVGPETGGVPEVSRVPNWRAPNNPDIQPVQPTATNLLGVTPNAEMIRPRQWENRSQAMDLAQALRESEAPKVPTSGGQLYDLDPVTGKLVPVDQGLKGATPDTIVNTGSSLKSAIDKLSSQAKTSSETKYTRVDTGEVDAQGAPIYTVKEELMPSSTTKGSKSFDLTADEKIAWNKAKADLQKVAPELKSLSEDALAAKFQDRELVSHIVQQARQRLDRKAAAEYESFAKQAAEKYATKQQQARAIADYKESSTIQRMRDSLSNLEELEIPARPAEKSGQGPKTREFNAEQLAKGLRR